MGLTFLVDENVLIPRQDTEILVEQCAGDFKDRNSPRSATGRPCFWICVQVPAVSCSVSCTMRDAWEREWKARVRIFREKALDIAKQNAGALGIRAEFICGDLFANIRGKYSMILSNPPYIRSSDIDALQEEVRLHDPREALDGKEDGLYFYRRITDEAREYLLPGGCLIFEIGYDQAEDVSAPYEQRQVYGNTGKKRSGRA